MRYLRKLQEVASAAIAVAFIIVFASSVSSAQQITAPTVPSTQSPQSTQTGTIPATGSVQESTAYKVLDSATGLSIPAGQPASAPAIEAVEEPSDRLWLIAPIALLIGIGSGTWILINRNTQSFTAPIELDTTNPVADNSNSLPKKSVEARVKKPKPRARSKTRSGKKKKKKK